MSTLTNANSTIMLSVGGIFPVAQQLQGYATDDMFSAEDVQSAEIVMGVDGKQSGGYTPYPTLIEIMLQADSSSAVIFDTWGAFEDTARELFLAQMTIILPGTGQKFACSNGYLKTKSKMPAGKKILQPRKWSISFESVSPAPV